MQAVKLILCLQGVDEGQWRSLRRQGMSMAIVFPCRNNVRLLGMVSPVLLCTKRLPQPFCFVQRMPSLALH